MKGKIWMAVAIITTAACILINKAGLSSVPPMMFAVWRSVFLVAGLILVVSFMGLTKKMLKTNAKNLGYLVLSGLTGSYLGYLGIFYGQKFTSATNAGFLTKLTALFAAILAPVYLKEKVGGRHMLSLIISLVGVYFLATGGTMGIFMGDSLLVTASLLFAIGDVFACKAMDKTHPITAALLRNFFGLLFLFATLVLMGYQFPSLEQWLWISASGSSLLIFWIAFHYALKALGVAKAELWNLLSAVLVAGGSVLFMGETITLVQLIGGVLIIAGAALIPRIESIFQERFYSKH